MASLELMTVVLLVTVLLLAFATWFFWQSYNEAKADNIRLISYLDRLCLQVKTLRQELASERIAAAFNEPLKETK